MGNSDRAKTLKEFDGLSFKELDLRNHWVKGTAFRGFKALLKGLSEGEDYFYLEASTDAAQIQSLRQQGRIYATSVNAVFLSYETCERIERSA